MKLIKLEVEKFPSQKISMSEKVWNHDYNPRWISNNPSAVVLNDQWIPFWSLMKIELKIKVEKVESREISNSENFYVGKV